jgi:hypothetical protein
MAGPTGRPRERPKECDLAARSRPQRNSAKAKAEATCRSCESDPRSQACHGSLPPGARRVAHRCPRSAAGRALRTIRSCPFRKSRREARLQEHRGSRQRARATPDMRPSPHLSAPHGARLCLHVARRRRRQIPQRQAAEASPRRPQPTQRRSTHLPLSTATSRQSTAFSPHPIAPPPTTHLAATSHRATGISPHSGDIAAQCRVQRLRTTINDPISPSGTGHTHSRLLHQHWRPTTPPPSKIIAAPDALTVRAIGIWSNFRRALHPPEDEFGHLRAGFSRHSLANRV